MTTMFKILSSLLYLLLFISNLETFDSIKLEHPYRYFHFIMAATFGALLLGNVMATISACNSSSRKFFVKVYFGVLVFCGILQYLVLCNIWYYDRYNSLPFYTLFYTKPSYSILVVRITSCMYIVFPLIMCGCFISYKKSTFKNNSLLDSPTKATSPTKTNIINLV